MPFRVPSARIAQASPSISLEKGSYRMRAPPTRKPAARLQTSKSHARANGGPVSEFIPASHEKRMALLVVLLACATMASFGVAYYLWTTRPISSILLDDSDIPRLCTLFSRLALLS
ncbi:hypothetical protein GSI_02542 [Ganoderma sinense ZZ0214-1]|uniref:Uncharacterized protein n=1 Tax=Ganoderma sinense ZZ0214-1 TaxID=1077348 RepID=A0A2G8SLV2_9APHY|nr:hypothetical protein GSI_02542 [Ganoderma sinense ZZ0214-1]